MKEFNNVKKWGTFLGLLSIISVNAAEMALIGGQNETGNSSYAAFVSTNNTVIPLPSIAHGTIYSVAINTSGIGLLGGTNGSGAPFAALVSSVDGSMNVLSGTPGSGGDIYVAINASGNGILGGNDSSMAYSAFVTAGGRVSPYAGLPMSGYIDSVAINDFGTGLIGGQDGVQPFAAFVYSDGTVDSIDLVSPIFFPSGGEINSVAINVAGTGLIGGGPYAAFIYPDGTIDPFTLPPNLDIALISGVAINSSGTGLIGGAISNNIAYAAFVAPNGSVTSLFETSLASGTITSVSLNDSGTGLIGGQDISGNSYAAFVNSNGNVARILGLPPNGIIHSVAISNEGVGLLGGAYGPVFDPQMIASLVAPNGTVTPLTSLPNNGQIISVAFPGAILSSVVPKSYGPFSSLSNVMFDLTKVLERHYVMHHKNKTFKQLERSEKKVSKEIGLLADANMDIRMHRPDQKKPTISVWVSGFGDHIRQKAEEKIPSFTNKIAGAIVAAEYEFFKDRNAVVGGGLAYAFNDVHYGQRFGHSSINQEFAVVYGSFNKPHFFVNAALWGGLYQSHTKRNSSIAFTTVEISSKSNPKGWLLSPHLELSAPYYKTWNDWFMMEPFVMFDWANSWQRHFHEHGSSGFNIALEKQHFSMLRSEVGLRLYEVFYCGWGRFIIEEKGSYVNKKPFHTGASSAIFVGAASSFAIETFSNKVQNLGVAQMSFNFIPRNPKYPYGALDFQGEFGSTFQSYLLVLNVGKDF